MIKVFVIRSLIEIIIVVGLLYVFSNKDKSWAYNMGILLSSQFLYKFIVYGDDGDVDRVFG